MLWRQGTLFRRHTYSERLDIRVSLSWEKKITEVAENISSKDRERCRETTTRLNEASSVLYLQTIYTVNVLDRLPPILALGCSNTFKFLDLMDHHTISQYRIKVTYTSSKITHTLHLVSTTPKLSNLGMRFKHPSHNTQSNDALTTIYLILNKKTTLVRH